MNAAASPIASWDSAIGSDRRLGIASGGPSILTTRSRVAAGVDVGSSLNMVAVNYITP